MLCYVVISNLLCAALVCLGNSVCSSRECNFSCERCWSCMSTCKLFCVLYVALLCELVLVGGSNSNVRELLDVPAGYIQAVTTVSGLVSLLAFD